MLYHVSDNSKIKILIPKIPEGAIAMYENVVTKRICFSDSIDGCLSAIDPLSNKKYFVYTPVNEIATYKPTVNDVRDSKYTGEVWCLENVKVKLLGEIKVKDYVSKKRYNSGKGRVTIRYYPFEWIKYNKS